MNKKFFLLIILTIVLELGLSFSLIGKMKDVKPDPVLINECVHSVSDNFGNSSAYSDKLSYSVIDTEGKPLYKNADNLSASINEAIKHSDLVLDLEKDGEILGKIIINNSMTEEIKGYKDTLLTVIIVITLVQLLLVATYYLYLRKTIIKPFEELNSFAARVAQGNLDTPLELDKKHIFGSFTEAFDLMRSELKKSRAAEKKANDDKKEMVAKLSHDIKTPVASIKSTSELGYELASDEKTRERFNQINIKSDQVTALVSNLFNSSINDITEIEVRSSEQPSSLIKDLIINADYQNKAGSFTVPECRIFVDRLRLLQAFDNIFMNSYKYGGTDIDVSCFTENDCLVVRISDKGPGVNDEDLPLLKEKYKRGNNTEGKDGAGLGLYLTNYYIEKMDGHLELENLHPGFSVSVFLRIIN